MLNFIGLHISDLEIALKFQIEATTKLEPVELIDLICSLLKSSNYKVIKQSDLFVKFVGNSSSRYESFSMIDDGKFELEKLDEETQLQLTFNISILGDLFFIIPLTLAGILFNHIALLIFASVFIIQCLFKISTSKIRAEELFNNVINVGHLHI